MWSLIAALSAVLASPREEAGFRQLQERTFRLVDVTAVSGVDFRHETGATGEKYMTETMGSGVVFFDYDADGDPDLLFINGGDDPTGERAATSATSAAALYRNDGHGSFTDVTRAAGLEHIGYGMGATAGDYDNDGDDDLYVTNYEPNVLFRNSGDGTFSDVTTESGVGNSQWSASATWADLDNDGHLDLYVTNYVDFSLANNPICRQMRDGNEIRAYCLPDAFRGVADEIYRNWGDGTFESAGSRAGIALPSGKGLGVVSLDYDPRRAPRHLRRERYDAEFLFPESRRPRLRGDRAHYRSLLFESAAATSYLSQSEHVVHIGLGDEGRIEAIHVTWPGGYEETRGPFDADTTILWIERVR